LSSNTADAAPVGREKGVDRGAVVLV